MNLKKIFLIIASSSLILFSIYNISKSLNIITKADIGHKAHIEIAGNTFDVEVVSSKEEQERGLSGRNSLSEKSGMFFKFAQPAQNNMWMKDMKFPIDIIWLDEDYKTIFCVMNASPDSYPQTFGPKQNSKYVLEVNAGFCQKNNLRIGDSALFLP